jgi:transcriptional regulator with XRE-family HTH domain
MDTTDTITAPAVSIETQPPGRLEFGDRVRKGRAEHKLTQAELAKKIGTTEQTIRAWESGRTAITPKLMARLARALKTTKSDLWPEWSADQVRRGGPQTPTRIDR